jgi:hypothetical protein
VQVGKEKEPVGPAEEYGALEIAVIRWRLCRVLKCEAGKIQRTVDESRPSTP